MSTLSRLFLLCTTYAIIFLLSACQRSPEPGPVYDGSVELPLALAYIGAPDNMSVEGILIVEGPYHDLARQLVGIAMVGDSSSLLALLSEETRAFHGGPKGYLQFWAEQFTGKLYFGQGGSPRVFATLVEDLSDFGPHQNMLQWFDFPQQPEFALFLYSFAQESGMMGRMFYPTMENGAMRLILERPKDSHPSAESKL